MDKEDTRESDLMTQDSKEAAYQVNGTADPISEDAGLDKSEKQVTMAVEEQPQELPDKAITDEQMPEDVPEIEADKSLQKTVTGTEEIGSQENITEEMSDVVELGKNGEVMQKAMNLEDTGTEDSDEDSSSDEDMSEDNKSIIEEIDLTSINLSNFPKTPREYKRKLPALPKVLEFPEDATVSEAELEVFGNISSKIATDFIVVVRPKPLVRILDAPSWLFFQTGVPFGPIEDVCSSTKNPIYSIRFNDLEHMNANAFEVGTTLYFAPDNKMLTKYVFIEELKTKASDASGRYDKEIEISSDEDDFDPTQNQPKPTKKPYTRTRGGAQHQQHYSQRTPSLNSPNIGQQAPPTYQSYPQVYPQASMNYSQYAQMPYGQFSPAMGYPQFPPQYPAMNFGYPPMAGVPMPQQPFQYGGAMPPYWQPQPHQYPNYRPPPRYPPQQ